MQAFIDRCVRFRCTKGKHAHDNRSRLHWHWLIIGAIAGWLASLIVTGGGLGLIGDIIVGIVGAVIAGYLLPTLGIYTGDGFVAAIVNAVIGAVVLLVIVRLGKGLMPKKA
jgi:uncharacterized membrane protein YeaQ/YmgE (transglycosylase-associated protein family)